MYDAFFTLKLNQARDALVLLDQTLLPGEEKYISVYTTDEIHEAIRSLRVRGAPAIGVAAAYGMYLAARASRADSPQGLLADVLYAKERLASSRPTAVNLFWALEKMHGCLTANAQESVAHIKEALLGQALAIHEEDEAACRAIGDYGLALLRPGMRILTHCNAGALAATRYGTALSPIYRGHERGYGFRVYADETRPLLQGARLTAWELQRAGVDVTLLCDGMGASLMQKGQIDACIVGCDRLAANGDAANKIGTLPLALAARALGVPFYVAAPFSTLDVSCASGADIVIEHREPSEVTSLWYARPMAPEGVKVFNPAFDVTPAAYITAIITERGVATPPFAQSLRALDIAGSTRTPREPPAG